MSFRKILVFAFFFVLFEWLGYGSFATCHAIGGGIISCGLIGCLIGFMKAAIFIAVLFLTMLIHGLAHLFGH